MAGALRATSAAAGRQNAKLEPRARLNRQRHVPQCREPGQDLGDLERARNAAAGPSRHGEVRDVAAVEDDAAGIGRRGARDSG